MKTSSVELNPNKLVQYLKKPASEFTKDDIIKFIKENGIQMLNYRYVGGDGRLKALNFVINSEEHLDTILSTGERVDGSSLFPAQFEAGSSDLYVVPKYRTAFVNPFEEIPTLDILCSYFDKEGTPLSSSPENILKKARQVLIEKTGYDLQAMGELEYYVICNKDEVDMDFPAEDQRGYHEDGPFTKFGQLRKDALLAVAQAGGLIKYGHSEVGNFTDDEYYYEQNEIEFETTDIEDSADRLIIAKWVLRMLGQQYGVKITYAPKITVGKAGTGLHIHMKLTKDGKPVMIENGKLTDPAKKVIAGVLEVAGGVTAFGNRVPTSYLRLVPHQEAPTNICWGDRNRSALIRVPLGWAGEASKMITKANSNYSEDLKDYSGKQTYEFRAADGSADIYGLLASLCVGARYGLEMENGLARAEELYVSSKNIFDDENKDTLAKLDHLPASCWESADALLAKKDIFMQYDIFTEDMLNAVAAELKAFDDYQLSEKLYGKNDEIKALVDKYIHCA